MNVANNAEVGRSSSETNIVILGGGFGGLTAAKSLAKRLRHIEKRPGAYRITLIDKNEYHTYTPTLYEIATTTADTATYSKLKSIATFPLAEVLRPYNVAVMQATVVSIDTERNLVSLSTHEQIQWDYLIVALGAETNYFGISGMQRNAIPLKTFEDAIRIRNAILKSLTENEKTTIIIGGGGATGVELAGEIQTWIRSKDIKKAVPEERETKVILIEGKNAILHSFPQKIRRIAHRRLRSIGVGIITKERIVSVKKNEISLLSGQRLPFSIFIWAGGTALPTLLKSLQTKTNSSAIPKNATRGEENVCLQADHTMRLIMDKSGAHERIYVIGDNAHCINKKTGEAVPAVAHAAISQARVAAAHIAKALAEKKHIRPAQRAASYYPPRAYSAVIPIGGKFAVVKLGPITFSGILGWILKGLIELYYLFSIVSPARAVRTWLRGLWIFIKNDRLG